MRRILTLLVICFYCILCFSQINDTISIHDVEIKDKGEYVQIGDEHNLVSDSVGFSIRFSTLEVDGGVITNADVLIKDGGKLKLTNGGTIRVSQYGEIETELGSEVEFLSGEILLGNE